MECPVCLNDMTSSIRATPPCGHVICLRCLLSLRKKECVLCRADLEQFFPPQPAFPVVTLHTAIFGRLRDTGSWPSPPEGGDAQ